MHCPLRSLLASTDDALGLQKLNPAKLLLVKGLLQDLQHWKCSCGIDVCRRDTVVPEASLRLSWPSLHVEDRQGPRSILGDPVASNGSWLVAAVPPRLPAAALSGLQGQMVRPLPASQQALNTPEAPL